MVNLPSLPFKISEVGDEHPLVQRALRGTKPYELCWCGSGRKFKKCHRFREDAAPLSLGQMLDEQSRIFWRCRGCMHPDASTTSCSGKIIDAHTIQRKGPLQRITDDGNHVCQLQPSHPGIEVVDIGWKKASTFPGYCAEHDSRTFGMLERVPFSGTHEQCVLQTYRNICNELYLKRALLESLEYQRMVIDRGCDLDTQIERQLSVTENINGQMKSMRELEALWRVCANVVTKGQYEQFSSRCYFFEGELCVTSAGALHAEFDFHGKQLVDMWDLEIDAEMLSHSIMVTDTGGAIVFTWLAGASAPAAVVRSFEELKDEDKGDIFVQYCFLNCENTYFSRAWWEKLPRASQEQLKRFGQTLNYEGGPFVANQHRLVDWNFVSSCGHGEP